MTRPVLAGLLLRLATLAGAALSSCTRAAPPPAPAPSEPPKRVPVSSSASSRDASPPPPLDAERAERCPPPVASASALSSSVVARSRWDLVVDRVGERTLVLAGDRIYDAGRGLAPMPDAARGLRAGARAVLGSWPDGAWAVSDFTEGEGEYPVMQTHVDRWDGKRWTPAGSLSAARAWASAPGGFLSIDMASAFHPFGTARAPAAMRPDQGSPSALAVVRETTVVAFDAAPDKTLARTCVGCTPEWIRWSGEAVGCGVDRADYVVVEGLATGEDSRAAAILRPQIGSTPLHVLVEGGAASGEWRASLLPAGASANAFAVALAGDGSTWAALDGPTLLRRRAGRTMWESIAWPSEVTSTLAKSELLRVTALVAGGAEEAWVALSFTRDRDPATGSSGILALLVRVGSSAPLPPITLGR